MRKAFPAAAFILALSFSALASVMFVGSATADPIPRTYLPKITINGDGSITPETSYVNRVGNVYTLTADIIEEYSIEIYCSNIVFDGAGHTIKITKDFNSGVSLHSVTNVTVKNLEISGRDIVIYSSSNCLITGVNASWPVELSNSDFNTITECTSQVFVNSGSENNLFLRNNIIGYFEVFSGSNIFSQNNILLEEQDLPEIFYDNFWDNGSIGNYWSHYFTRYPNASEIGNSGIGNTPYVIERGYYSTRHYPNASNIDYYPLMYPYDIEKGTIALPSPELQPEPAPEPFLIALAVGASGASIAGVAVCVFYFQKKRNR